MFDCMSEEEKDAVTMNRHLIIIFLITNVTLYNQIINYHCCFHECKSVKWMLFVWINVLFIKMRLQFGVQWILQQGKEQIDMIFNYRHELYEMISELHVYVLLFFLILFVCVLMNLNVSDCVSHLPN